VKSFAVIFSVVSLFYLVPQIAFADYLQCQLKVESSNCPGSYFALDVSVYWTESHIFYHGWPSPDGSCHQKFSGKILDGDLKGRSQFNRDSSESKSCGSITIDESDGDPFLMEKDMLYKTGDACIPAIYHCFLGAG